MIQPRDSKRPLQEDKIVKSSMNGYIPLNGHAPATKRTRGVLLLLIIFSALLQWSSTSLAQPTSIGYQGELLKDGNKYTGTAAFKFVLVSEDGAQSLWSNDGTSANGGQPTGSVNIGVTQGVFSVQLGTSPMVPIDANVIGTATGASLRVWVNTGAGFEQLSDQPVASSPFSMHADGADGAPGDFHAVGFVQSGDSALFMIHAGNPSGTPDRLVTDHSSNRLCLGRSNLSAPTHPYDTGVFDQVRVGIGKLNPTECLDVNGKLMVGNPGPSNNAAAINTSSRGLAIWGPTAGRHLDLYTDGTYNDLHSYGAALSLNHVTTQNVFLCFGGGNVGIGTTSPAQRLDVAGRARIRSLPAPVGSVNMVVSDVNGDLYQQPIAGGGITLPYAGTGSTSDPNACSPGVFSVKSTGSGIPGVVGCYQAGLNGVAGVLGVGQSPGTVGVKGDGNNGGGSIGVWGDASYGIAVQGIATGNQPSASIPTGVYGKTMDSGSTNPSFNGGIGVKGEEPAASWHNSNKAWAGYFLGDVNITGDLTVTGLKAFRIDHPLDPTHKYLVHSCVESNEMMNIYKGRVTTDANGEAVVDLPNYFEALNRGIEYHLTVIGQFAQAMIADEVKGNRFRIKTDKPNVMVSWQVLGVRQDAEAKAHPMAVEVDKPAQEESR
jgi:hypothetical protein